MPRNGMSVPAAAAAVALVGCNLASLSSAPTPPATPTPSAVQTAAPTPTPTPGPSSTPKPTKTVMFVINGLSNSVDKVDLLTGTVTKNVLAAGKVPNQLVVSGTSGYVVNSTDANVFKFDLLAVSKSGEITLPVGSNPACLALYGNGKGLVSNYLAKTAVLVDLGSGATEATIPLPQGQPTLGGVAVTQGKAYVPVSSANDSWVYIYSAVHVIDLAAKSVTKTIPLANDANPFATTLDPDNKIQVSTSTGVTTIDPATDTVVRNIDFGTTVTSVGYLNAEKAYGVTSYDGLVSFNPRTGAILRNKDNRINAGGGIYGNFKIRGDLAYVPNFASDSVTVVDLVAETATGSPYQVGDGPQDVGFITVDQ